MAAACFVLTLAVVLSSVLLITGLARTRRGQGGPLHDLYEAAFLNGGPGRVVDTALTAMQADGRLNVGGPGIVAVLHPVAHDPVERAVLQEHAAAPSGALHTLRVAVMRHPAVQETGHGLAARGLLAAPGASAKWRVWGLVQTLLCFLALPVAFGLAVNGFMSDNGGPGWRVPFFVVVVPAVAGGFVSGLVCAAVARSRVTRAGRGAAAEFRAVHAHRAEPAFLVAVHGLRAVPDPALRTHLIAAARTRPVRPSHTRYTSYTSTDSSGMLLAPSVWCAGSSPGGGCGSSPGSSCGGANGCGSGSSCGSSGSSCGGGSSGSSCGGGSSCGSSGSSCGGGSSCGSSS
ncbi:TIGR04222 domain-containing membrane protein [Streptomyces sp. NPDC006976]|uniref:TIGR04222 domain-containing membrane protein n=1 Tax=Streptomyces sp. NPDC006976 TaxID=3154311 RepID=UPI0033D88410